MIEDRAYQKTAISKARASFVSGHRAVLLVAPTGAGKTTIASEIACGRIAKGGRVACYAHRRELVVQMAERLRLFGLEVGTFGECANARVQVCMAQTVLERRVMPEADLVFLDEAHHYVAKLWGDIPKGYDAARALIVGLTATPERGDGKGLGRKGDAWGFDDLVLVAQIRELVSLGFLVSCSVFAPKTTPRKLALEPWEAFQRYADGLSTVVFAPHVKAAHSFAADFNARGIRAGVVHGELALEDRDGTLARFAAGDLPVLVNVNVLTEGWDCPRAKVAILARKIGSPSLYLQMVGRVLRPDGTGTSARLIDLCGNVALHGPPEEDRIYSLDGAAVTRRGQVVGISVRICRRCKAEVPFDAEACSECGKVLDELDVPKGEGIELDKFAWAKELPSDKRVDRLARWYGEGLEKSYKRGWADFRYRGVFGHHPPTDVKVAAWKKASEAVRDRVVDLERELEEKEETGT